MATHDGYDKKLLKGIEKIADRIDKIERKMPGDIEQTEGISIPDLSKLVKENKCKLIMTFSEDGDLFVEVYAAGHDNWHGIGTTIKYGTSEEDILHIIEVLINELKE